MMTDSLSSFKDLLHAQLCYQLFITPLHLPIDKKYRDFARKACEFIELKRTEVIHNEHPRHHVIHHFKPNHSKSAPKVLITHGWLSRSAYMLGIIRALHKDGYDVYAIDFPAHGEAKGFQLPWTDASSIIRHVLNEYGPFQAAVGHSFGGSMLLNTLNLAGQKEEWKLKTPLDSAILIASPIHMRYPVNCLARKLKLNGQGYLYLRQLFRQQTEIDPSLVRLHHFISQEPKTSFLCIHGQQDESISTKESISFCQKYPKARLCLLDEADHVSVLMDKRVEQEICQFLNNRL